MEKKIKRIKNEKENKKKLSPSLSVLTQMQIARYIYIYYKTYVVATTRHNVQWSH